MTKQEYLDKIKANWNNPYIDKYQILMRNTEVSVDYASDLEIENERLKAKVAELEALLSHERLTDVISSKLNSYRFLFTYYENLIADIAHAIVCKEGQ